MLLKRILNHEQDLTDEAVQALEEIFNRYDRDVDGCLNETEIQKFAKDTNGEEFSAEELKECREYLDCDDFGSLTLKGFIEMFALQTSSDEEQTWKDLKVHGFSKKESIETL